MADRNRLITWLLENSKSLNLRATEFDWTHKWNLGAYCDFRVQIDIQGKTFTGRAMALGEDFAFLKAGAEAIERAYCSGHSIHTTGVAVHTDADMAKENTQNELNERDAFFCHYYTKTPFFPLPQNYLYELMQEFKGFFDATLSLGIKYRLFRARSAGNNVYICNASGISATPQFGGIIGLGSHNNDWRSIKAAFTECARNVAAVVLADKTPEILSEAEFSSLLYPTALDRQKLARNVDYWKNVSVLFPEYEGGYSEQTVKPIGADRWPWRLNKLECPFDELKGAPVVVFRAVLDEKYGEPIFKMRDRSPTTLERLRQFLERPVSKHELEVRPHFIG